MGSVLKRVVFGSMFLCFALSGEELKQENKFDDIFKNGTVSGQVTLGYVYFDKETSFIQDSYASAIGGQLKYETDQFHGLSFGAAFYTSHTLRAVSGDVQKNKFDPYLASSKRSYSELGESYVKYKYHDLELKFGRQTLDTPLIDSDFGISMTPNSFEAYMISYQLNDFTFILGDVRRWQGFDSDYLNVTGPSWPEIGIDNKGSYVGSIAYANEKLEVSFWLYNMNHYANIGYVDVLTPLKFNENVELSIAAQYMKENELSDKNNQLSNLDGEVYGLMAELKVSNFGVYAAQNKAKSKANKSIGAIYGGGPFFTSMENLTVDSFTAGQGGVTAKLYGFIYSAFDVDFSYYYGKYLADPTQGSTHQNIAEQNFYAEYSYNDKIDFMFVYVVGEDKGSFFKTEYDNNYVRAALNYNF